MVLKNIKNRIFAFLMLTVLFTMGIFVLFKAGKEAYADTLEISINNVKETYDDDTYGVVFNGSHIDLGSLPVMYYRNVLVGRGKKIFESLGCKYTQDSDNIVIKYGDISVSMTFDSDIAFVNGKKIIMDAPAVFIMKSPENVSYAFVPMEFCLEALGFDYEYNMTDRNIVIRNINAGIYNENKYLKSMKNVYASSGSTGLYVPENRLFEFTYDTSYETLIENKGNESLLTGLSGFSLDHSDAIALYGVKKEDLNVVIDGNWLYITLPNVKNLCSDQFYNNESAKYLKYCLLSGSSSATISLLIEADQTYYVYGGAEGYVSVHVTGENVSETDPGITVKLPAETPAQNNNTDVPDDRLLIPVPAGTEISSVRDYDNYLNYNFTIQIKGNISDYIKEKGIRNPYSLVEGYAVSYNKNSGYTVVSFDTKLIMAYTYEMIGDYIAVRVARPNEIYKHIVLLDAGHGGTDPGAIAQKVYEKDLNFKIMNTLVSTYFTGSDIKIYYTRTTDVLITLSDRVKMSQECCADIFVSLHMNSNYSYQPNGTEVYYSSSNNDKQSNGLKSSIMAKYFVDNLSAALGTKNRGAASENFYVVKYNKIPAVLIELGFMSNQSDFEKLTSETYQKKAAETIYKTIVQIFKDYP